MSGFYPNRASQCREFKRALVRQLPKLTRTQHRALWLIMSDCYICGAAEERSRILGIPVPVALQRTITETSILEVLGFEKPKKAPAR
jgi:hypothetical protein